MTRQPRITPSQVDVATAERLPLKNGIDLYMLPSDDFEVLRISFVFRAGSAAAGALLGLRGGKPSGRREPRHDRRRNCRTA